MNNLKPVKFKTELEPVGYYLSDNSGYGRL